MSDYVAFKCSLCSAEAGNLEILEAHIWNTHLGTFQYRCAECNYPALNYQALVNHFHEKHPSCQEVEFRRLINHDIKLRSILSSSIVVPYYDDEEQIYDDRNEVPQMQVLETVESGSEVISESMQVEDDVDSQGQIIEQVGENGQLIYVATNVKSEYQDYINDHKASTSMIGLEDGQVVAIQDDNGDLVDCEDDSTYAIYSGHDLLDDNYHYVDEEGNTVYVTDQFPHTSKEPTNIQLRAMKHRHMNMIVDDIAGKMKKKRSTTIWTCTECGKTIRYPSRIEEHRRMHAGGKPYACPDCGQKFAQKGGLKCHMRQHSGEKPYACTWDCGKTFVSASAQRMHEKYHSGEKPFSCRVCGKLFGKRSHLMRHEQSVHQMHTLEVLRPPQGLDIAGPSEAILKGIVNSIVEEVRSDRLSRESKKEDSQPRSEYKPSLISVPRVYQNSSTKLTITR